MRNRLSVLLALAGSVLFVSCFEDPVAEKVDIRLRPDGYAEVTHQITFSSPGAEGNKALAARIDALRNEHVRQQDRWSQLMSLASPELETLEWHREGGVLKSVRQSGVVSLESLDRLFAQQGLTFSRLDDEQWHELSIYPGASRRATREQQQRVAMAFDGWAMAVADYVEAMRAVYDHAERNPSRAAAVLRPLFADLLADGEKESTDEEGTSEETALVQRAEDAMNRVTEVVSFGPDQPYTLNELSLLVYDPFGYDLSITCVGEILQASGFARRRERTVTHPRRSLWSAFEALEGTWLSPDPLLMKVRKDRARDDTTIPLQRILEGERFAVRSLSGHEARRALEKALQPPEILRVRCGRDEG